MARNPSKKAKLVYIPDVIVDGGMTPEWEKKFVWQIHNYDKIHADFSLVKAESFTFEVDLVGLNIPLTSWEFYLLPKPGEGSENEGSSSEMEVGVYLRLKEKPHTPLPPVTSNLFGSASFEIQKRDGSFYLNRDTQLKELSTFCKGWGYRLFGLTQRLSTIPLDSNGSLVIQVGLKIFSRGLAEPTDSHSAKLELARNMMENYARLFETMENSDVTIYANDGTLFRAHKAILSAQSPVFRTMFGCGMQEDRTGEVKVADLSGKVVKYLLRFIYTGEVFPYVINVEGSRYPCVSEILYGATKYQLDVLVNHLDNKIGGLCDARNVKFLLELVNKFGLPKAQNDVKKFLTCNPLLLGSVLDSQ